MKKNINILLLATLVLFLTADRTTSRDIFDPVSRMPGPKILILIQETITDRRSQYGFTKTEISIQEILAQSNFRFVHFDQAQEKFKSYKRDRRSKVKGRHTVKFEKFLYDELNVQILIFGTTTTRWVKMGKPDPLKAKYFSTRIRLKATHLENGKILAAASREAGSEHIDNTIGAIRGIDKALNKLIGFTKEDGTFVPGSFITRMVSSYRKLHPH